MLINRCRYFRAEGNEQECRFLFSCHPFFFLNHSSSLRHSSAIHVRNSLANSSGFSFAIFSSCFLRTVPSVSSSLLISSTSNDCKLFFNNQFFFQFFRFSSIPEEHKDKNTNNKKKYPTNHVNPPWD